jgi:hypothetical protein
MFGAISIFIFAICMYAMFVHYKLMKKRGAVDDCISALGEDEQTIKNFNEAVTMYNAHISKFPASVMAKILNFEKETPL